VFEAWRQNGFGGALLPPELGGGLQA